MYKEAKYITTVCKKNKKTTYLLCKNPQILIPLELKDEATCAYPDFKTLCVHILNALKAKVVCAKIYRYQDEIFYSYITLKQNGNCIDVNAPPIIALKACQIFRAPLLVNEAIVKGLGFRITKQMVEEALQNGDPWSVSY